MSIKVEKLDFSDLKIIHPISQVIDSDEKGEYYRARRGRAYVYKPLDPDFVCGIGSQIDPLKRQDYDELKEIGTDKSGRVFLDGKEWQGILEAKGGIEEENFWYETWIFLPVNLNIKRQMVPSRRTVGDLIEILRQYPENTLISGVTIEGRSSPYCTVQGNCPDGILNNIGIYFYDEPL